MLLARESSGGGNPIPQGVTLAVCVGVWDVGTTFSEQFGKSVHKVIFMWETEHKGTAKDGSEYARTISQSFTLSLHEKSSMRKTLEAWRGKAFDETDLRDGFDLHKMLGVDCQLQIGHETKHGKTRAGILSIMSLPKGMKPLTPTRPAMYLELTEDGTWTIPAGTPQWIADMVKASDEWEQHFGVAETTSVPAEESQESVINEEKQPF